MPAKKEAWFLIIWFISFWFIFFSSWVQVLGGRERFFLGFYPAIVIFAGYGMQLFLDTVYKTKLRTQWKGTVYFLIVAVPLFLCFPYALGAKQMHNSSCARLETKIPELAENDIPPDAVIVANWPTILRSTTNLNIIDVNDFLLNRGFQNDVFQSTNLLLFFEDYCCFDFHRCYRCKANCEAIKQNFKLEPYKEYREGSKKYTFYKIIARSDR